MKTIVPVNTMIPGLQDYIDYDSGESLQDYDVVLFDPSFPYYSREHFTAGGSCITVDSGETLRKSLSHWKSELLSAIGDGKTVFFLLSEHQRDSVATGSSYVKGSRTFHTMPVSNHEVLPVSVHVRNSKGKKVKLIDKRFTELFSSLEEYMAYQVVIEDAIGKEVAATVNGSNMLATCIKLKGHKGNLVLLPYFNLSNLSTTNAKDEEVWTKKGMGIGGKLIKMLVELDKTLRKESLQTPTPEWVNEQSKPKLINDIQRKIADNEGRIEKLQEKQVREREALERESRFQALLYETGTILEEAIEESLRLLGYEVENYRNGNVEIDHVITSPSGIRMIGEAEGKDTSAIDISKFRQLESNIGEDFERDEIEQPAKGIIFGNGYRFTVPSERKEQFTDKCFTNAKRLGTALIQTSDLYPVVVYLQDNPGDEAYKEACRGAIEGTQGELVKFSDVPTA